MCINNSNILFELCKIYNVKVFINHKNLDVRHSLEKGQQQVGAVLVPQADRGVREQCINMIIYD